MKNMKFAFIDSNVYTCVVAPHKPYLMVAGDIHNRFEIFV